MNLDGLPLELVTSLTDCLNAGRRWYVAWRPDFQFAVLRHKEAIGLEAWESRDWRIFDRKQPTITDVTEAIPDLWRAMVGDAMKGRRIVFQPPAGLALVTGTVKPGQEFDLTAETPLGEVAGRLPVEPKLTFWETMAKGFGALDQTIAPIPEERPATMLTSIDQLLRAFSDEPRAPDEHVRDWLARLVLEGKARPVQNGVHTSWIDIRPPARPELAVSSPGQPS